MSDQWVRPTEENFPREKKHQQGRELIYEMIGLSRYYGAMLTIDPRGYFITGSDTGVGKTYIACEIIRQLGENNIEVETRKPAESGCGTNDKGELLAADALALKRANNNRETIERIVAYRFRAALAPQRAARLEGGELHLEQLLEACRLDNAAACLIVEGAGGFYSPLAQNGLNADLATALQLAVIIVVDDRLGAVNQALMSIQAVEHRQLRIAALILNQVKPELIADMDNAIDLRDHCDYPIVCCLHGEALPNLFEDRHADI